MKEVEKKGRAVETPAPESGGKEEFPAGMRVLAVDDDPICLKMLESLLRKCRYKVTVTPQAATALKLLRENKDKFDIVISDVHMPDMDGFKLLEIVGLEMDLPVIMMSANSEVSTVMKGITHGARDYLLKPIRIEELKNIWQHVIRKTLLEPKEGNDTTDRDKCGTKRGSVGASKFTKKSRDQNGKEHEADDLSVEDQASQKKQRVTWSRELHKQFISAVEQLGIENAVPKRILDVMNATGLTRENVASHLQQKYRKALKLNSVEMNPGGNSSDRISSNPPTTGLESFDKQHMKTVDCLKGFQIDGYNSKSDISCFKNVQNPGTFRVSYANAKSVTFLPNPHDVLLQRYAKAPEAHQLFHILPNTKLGDASTDALNYLAISPRTEQLDTFKGLPSYIPGYNVYSRSETNRNCLPEYAPGGHSFGITFGAAESSCSEVRDGTANDCGAIAPLGIVQNSPPGQYEGPNVSNFQPGVVNADFETSFELEISSMGLATGNGHLKLIGDPDAPVNLGINDMFDLSNSDSLEDLGAVVKQFHHRRNSETMGL